MILSIIVPVYNAEKYLSRCIESIITQEFTDWELLSVDDGSTDGSDIICDKYASESERISVIHQENQGVSIARNTGIRSAKGEWVGFVDADDYIEPEMYSVLLSAAIDSGADLSWCDLFSEERETTHTITSIEVSESKIDILRSLLRDGWGGLSMNKIYHIGLFKKHKLLFPQNITYAEDLLFTVHAFLCSNTYVKVPRPLYHSLLAS